jgi:hypothetical protein
MPFWKTKASTPSSTTAGDTPEQSIVPQEAPVAGAVGVNEERKDDAAAGSSSFQEHAVENEKVVEHYAPGNTSNDPITENKDVEATAEASENTEEDDEANIVYPSGLKLALLTFGLCMAVFVVALDNTIIA